ncbi:MAG TPA: HEAT repeat domain-containing protein [bacterium]|nr:HEAT repeat domain-containing protein [bacterium]
MTESQEVPFPQEPADRTPEMLLSFLAEAWQFAQLQKKNLGEGSDPGFMMRSFDKLFDRLLDRVEKTSPELANIAQWFRTPEGQLLDTETIQAMFPLLEVAVRNHWTAVLYDPATEGLVNECLAYWDSKGRKDLVEGTVRCLAQGLQGSRLEKHLALTHLMDARPWFKNPDLSREVLGSLTRLLGEEKVPGHYQSALLLAWDLLEPALAASHDREVLALLTTLHFHAEEDIADFPERAGIARQWIYGRSTPDMVRRFARLAHEGGQLAILPQLAEMAAPLLMQDYFKNGGKDREVILSMLAEMKEATRSVLATWLADSQQEENLKALIPILKVSGWDAPLALQVAAWTAKAKRELKLNLLGVIEEMADPAGGPALRLAVLDDSEEIAARAADVMGRIGFSAGLPLLLKSAKIRESRGPGHEEFLMAVCRAAGELKGEGALEFLEEIARKKSLLRGKNYPLPMRLEAIKALAKLDRPEVWTFLESMMEEKNQPLQETLDGIIHERIQAM